MTRPIFANSEGWIDMTTPKVDPAPRAVDGCAKEDRHERAREEDEAGADEARVVQAAVVDRHRAERQDRAEKDGDRLLDDEE